VTPHESWNELIKTLTEAPQRHDPAETTAFFPGFVILPCATTAISQICLVCATSMQKWLPRNKVKS